MMLKCLNRKVSYSYSHIVILINTIIIYSVAIRNPAVSEAGVQVPSDEKGEYLKVISQIHLK